VAEDSKVHISYWDRTHNALKHATGTGNSWKTSSVDTAGNVGFFTSIAAGKSGSLSISYHSETQHSLKVASLAGEEWKIATVDNNGMPGFGTSIAFARDGGLWLAEVNSKQKALSCFVRAGDGSWREMKLSSEGDFSAPDLKMGPSDQAHIAYHDKQGLYVASLSNGTWNKVPIALGPRIGAARIAVSPNGAIHASFMDFSTGVLKYASNSSGQWQSGEVVVSKDGAGPGAIAIAIGLNGTVQIAYSYEDHGKKSLRYATGSCEANEPAK